MRHKYFLKLFLFLILILLFSVSAYAHPGRLDSNGGHYDRSTGQYHYHDGSSAGKNNSDSSDSYSYSHFAGPTTDYSYNSDSTNTNEKGKKPQLPEAVFWVLAFCIVICFNFVIPMLLDKKPTKTHTPSNDSSDTNNQSEEEKSRLIRERATQEFYSQQYAKPEKFINLIKANTKHKFFLFKILDAIFYKIDNTPKVIKTLIYIFIIILMFAFFIFVWGLLVVLVNWIHGK